MTVVHWRQALGAIGAEGGLSALPAVCYGSKNVFAAESERIFAQSWVCVGRFDRWLNPGDYACLYFAGTSAIVLMGRTGRLTAFANVCRHRGARLLDGDGNCRAIRCPLHRWTYGLDGELLVANQMHRPRRSGEQTMGLVRLPIASHEGFVFVNSDGQAGELREWMGDFSVRHSPWQLAGLKTVRRRELLVDCDWKLFLEGFNDNYRLASLHPCSRRGLRKEAEMTDRAQGAYVSHLGTNERLAQDQAQSPPPMAGPTDPLACGTRYTWVFPNLSFAASGEAVRICEVYPIDARRTKVVMPTAFPVATVRSSDFAVSADYHHARLDLALDEDLVALANQHHGSAARGTRASRFSSSQANLGAFARWYARRLEAV